MSGAPEPERRRHVISALVVDRPGTLNRVAGLFRARSFNIESLTVGTTAMPGRSRMTVVTRGDEAHLHQVFAQLERLIEVLEVTDLTHTPHVEVEMALAEVAAPDDAASAEAVRAVVEGAGGAVLSTDDGAWRVRLTAAPEQIDAAIEALRGHGLRGLVRAGSVAMVAERTPEPSPTPEQIGAAIP